MTNKKQNMHIVATSVTGPYHRAKNLPCQDFYAHACRGDRLVAVVSDGAGSARYGKIGAKTVCDTLCDILISGSLHNVRQKVIDALEAARQKLIYHRFNKSKSENGLIDFAATVVGTVYTKKGGLFFHIGDGAAIALNDSHPHIIVSRPENGLFSCETYFFTMDDWKDSLRFTPFDKANSLMLMTDGVTSFAFTKGFDNIENGFVEPINRFLHSESNRRKAVRALNNTLDAPRACHLNPDDKTLLWVGLR